MLCYVMNHLWGETSVGRNAHTAKHLWGEMSFHGAKCPWAKKSINPRSFPGANAIAHNRNFFVPETRHAYSHITRVYAMYATITVVINIKKEPVHHLLYETVNST